MCWRRPTRLAYEAIVVASPSEKSRQARKFIPIDDSIVINRITDIYIFGAELRLTTSSPAAGCPADITISWLAYLR
jgi:hypothetical protein